MVQPIGSDVWGLTIQQYDTQKQGNLLTYLAAAAAGVIPGSGGQLGLRVSRIRPQYKWHKYQVDNTGDSSVDYFWDELDLIVKRVNLAGFNCVFPIEGPPNFMMHTHIPGQDCHGHGLDVAGPADYAAIAAVLAVRYNGTTVPDGQGGFLHIDGFEISNEEWTFPPSCGTSNWDVHQFISGSLAGQCYAACYPVIHALYPTAIIAAGSENNLNAQPGTSIVKWINDFMVAVIAAGVTFPAYLNMHYYGASVEHGFGGNIGLRNSLKLLKKGIAQQTATKVPIRVTETGIDFNVHPPKRNTTRQVQAQYLYDVCEFLRTDVDGQVVGVDWYTLADGDSYSLLDLNPTRYYQAFQTYQQEIATHPTWEHPTPPPPPPVPGPMDENTFLGALSQIVPLNTELAINSPSGTGIELVYINQKYALAQGRLPAILLSSGPQDYHRNSTTTYTGTWVVYADYYDSWVGQSNSIDLIREDIALELERIKSNIETSLDQNQGISTSGIVSYAVSMLDSSIGGYTKALEKSFPGKSLGYRRLSMTFNIPPFSTTL